MKGLVTEYKEMLETKNAYVKKFSLEVYSNFDSSYPMWLAAVQSIAQLDALMGLAKGSINLGGIFNVVLLDKWTVVYYICFIQQSLRVDPHLWTRKEV